MNQMTKIRVGLSNGRSEVIEFTKPFEYITPSDVRAKASSMRIAGWVKL